ALLRRFFELLEANAREDWSRPHEWLGQKPARDEDEEEEKDAYASAYEGMTYKDSTDDGVEGSIAGDPPEPVGEFSLEAQADEIEDKLGFLHAIAKLWRLAARLDIWAAAGPAGDAALAAWLTAARRANDSLDLFL